MFFGKIKGTNDEWGFDVFNSNFESFIEIDKSKHMSIVNEANSKGKLIKGDADGNPILVDPPEPSEKEKAEQRINVLEKYLRDTDWYAIRFADTEEPIPDEIKKRRQDARDEISKLRDIPVSKPEEEPEEVFFDYQIDSE